MIFNKSKANFRTKFLSATLLVLVIFNSCKKYDEGPAITFKSPGCRLVGDWDLEYFYMGDIDCTLAVTQQPLYGKFVFFFESETKEFGNLRMRRLHDFTGFHYDGDWFFDNSYNTLGLTRPWLNSPLKQIEPVGPLHAYGLINWKINKLTNKQLWIETNFNNTFCWAHYRKN